MENLSLGWLLGGGAVFGTFIVTFWGHIKNFYHQLISRVVVNIELEGYASEAMQFYLRNEFKASKWGKRHYIAWMLFVRSVKRVRLVGMETVPKTGRIYWYGWKPLLSSLNGESGGPVTEQLTASNWNANNLNISFVRGMFNTEDLINKAICQFNKRLSDNPIGKRHYIKYIFGSSGKHKIHLTERKHNNNIPTSSTDIRSCLQYRPLLYSFDELGVGIDKIDSYTLDNLALSVEAEQAIQEAIYWQDNEIIYQKYNVPWKRGWLLYGQPGTGKTVFARGIAEKLDLPIYIFDLASLYNNELQEEWTNMLSNVPCMVLIEDIDSTFDKRTNVTKEGSLTFDCLINCLDGIFKNDGVFLIVTTNFINKIDEALGTVKNDNVAVRPGRIDRAIYFDILDEQGRYKLAKRILDKHPNLWDKIVKIGEKDTGAQFQERCAKIVFNPTNI